MAVKTEKVLDSSGAVSLCSTFTVEEIDGELVRNTKDLLQVETNKVYTSPLVDVIEGYDNEGNPYSRFHYQEVDKIKID